MLPTNQNIISKIIEGWKDIWFNYLQWNFLISYAYNDFEHWVFFDCINGNPNPEPYKIILTVEEYDNLMELLNSPPEYDENIARILTRPTPWDD